MGGKPRYKRYKRFFYITGVLIILIMENGCQNPSLVNFEKGLFNKKGRFHLSKAEKYIQKGEFDDALSQNYKCINLLPYAAIFQKGLIYAHPEYSFKDYNKARDYFETIVQKRIYVDPEIYNKSVVLKSLIANFLETQKKYQDTAQDPQAANKQIDSLNTQVTSLNSCITNLQEELKNLKNQIENLKEVDMNLEEKKLGPLNK